MIEALPDGDGIRVGLELEHRGRIGQPEGSWRWEVRSSSTPGRCRSTSGENVGNGAERWVWEDEDKEEGIGEGNRISCRMNNLGTNELLLLKS
jgi:hypothetical protein